LSRGPATFLRCGAVYLDDLDILDDLDDLP
jgi:hypothetical protein